MATPPPPGAGGYWDQHSPDPGHPQHGGPPSFGPSHHDPSHQPGPPHRGQTHYGPPQQGPPQYGPPQQGLPQYGPSQAGPSQYGPPQYPSQQGPPQYGPPQYGPPQQPQPWGAPRSKKSPAWPWWVGGIAALVVIALLVVFLITRDRDQGVGPTTDPPHTDTQTDPGDELITLDQNAQFDADTVSVRLEIPAGFEPAPSFDPELPRWDRDSCYIGLTQFDVASTGVTDGHATGDILQQQIEVLEDQYDTVEDLGRSVVVLPVDGGGQIEFAVQELAFQRTGDGPVRWFASIMRAMPDSETGLSITYSCDSGTEPFDVAGLVEYLSVTP